MLAACKDGHHEEPVAQAVVAVEVRYGDTDKRQDGETDQDQFVRRR